MGGEQILGICSTIASKAMEKDPQRRYPSARHMAEDLRHFLDDEPIRARRITYPERVWRWCRRNPAVASLSASVLVLLLAITVGSLVMVSMLQARAAGIGSR